MLYGSQHKQISASLTCQPFCLVLGGDAVLGLLSMAPAAAEASAAVEALLALGELSDESSCLLPLPQAVPQHQAPSPCSAMLTSTLFDSAEKLPSAEAIPKPASRPATMAVQAMPCRDREDERAREALRQVLRERRQMNKKIGRASKRLDLLLELIGRGPSTHQSGRQLP